MADAGPMKTIGEEMKAARGKRTLRDVARALKLSPSYISDIENGTRTPPPHTICRIAKELERNSDRWLWLWLIEAMGAVNAAKASRYGAMENEQP